MKVSLLEIGAHSAWTNARAAREAAGAHERDFAIESLTFIAANSTNAHLRAVAVSSLRSLARRFPELRITIPIREVPPCRV